MLMDWKINIVEMTILPKAICRFNAIPIEIPMGFFTNEMNNSNISMETQKTPNGKKKKKKKNPNNRKKNNAGGIIHSDFKLYYKATVIGSVW